MPMDTGFSGQDAQYDFSRARRGQVFSTLAARMRREHDDVSVILPFDEVVAALGRRAERRLGLQTIELDSIVGTVDRSRREFDRSFRPTSRRVRQRWERIARAIRSGDSLPPIDVYRVGALHFVIDGHHRVSVSRALGMATIEASVTEILTTIPADSATRVSSLMFKSHERLFYERVPLPAEARKRIELPNARAYAALAEGVEAWGFRVMQARGELLSREQIAAEWFEQDFEPIVAALRAAGLLTGASEAEAYVRASTLRYLLLRTHEWNDDVMAQLREGIANPPAGADTLVHETRRRLGRRVSDG